MSLIFKNSEYINNIDENFIKVGESLNKTSDFIAYYQNFFPADDEVDTSMLQKNYETVFNSKSEYLFPSEEDVKALSKRSLANKEDKDHIFAQHFTDGTIKIYNKKSTQVKIREIVFKDKIITEICCNFALLNLMIKNLHNGFRIL